MSITILGIHEPRFNYYVQRRSAVERRLKSPDDNHLVCYRDDSGETRYTWLRALKGRCVFSLSGYPFNVPGRSDGCLPDAREAWGKDSPAPSSYAGYGGHKTHAVVLAVKSVDSPSVCLEGIDRIIYPEGIARIEE